MIEQNTNIPQFLNDSAENKFRASFSNIPNFVKYNDIDIMFNRFVREVTLPSYELELEERNYAGSAILAPVSRKNTGMDELIITFGADEKFLNYFNFQYYIKTLRYGQGLPFDRLRSNIIHYIDITRMDNENRDVRIVRFKDCFPNLLGALPMRMGNSDMPEFDVSFKYTEMILD